MLRPILITAAIIAGAATIATSGTVERATRIEIDTHIDLPHSAKEVWTVLADLDAYPEWNPYHVRAEGDVIPGSKIEVEIRKPNGNQVVLRPKIMEAEPGRSLVWGGGIKGLFRGVHRFDLERVSDTCTRLYHTEVFSGLFVSFAELGTIEEGYAGMNAALAERMRTVSGKSRKAC